MSLAWLHFKDECLFFPSCSYFNRKLRNGKLTSSSFQGALGLLWMPADKKYLHTGGLNAQSNVYLTHSGPSLANIYHDPQLTHVYKSSQKLFFFSGFFQCLNQIPKALKFEMTLRPLSPAIQPLLLICFQTVTDLWGALLSFAWNILYKPLWRSNTLLSLCWTMSFILISSASTKHASLPQWNHHEQNIGGT